MASTAASPVLLLSTERSGSNLTRSILNTHSGIAAPHPLETAYPWRKTAEPGSLSPRQRRALVRDVLINKHHSFQPLVETIDVDAVVDRLERRGPETFLDVQAALYGEYAATVDASTWVSKDPGEWDYLDEAFDYYDDLKVVYLVRDARDVVLSFKNSNVGRYHPYYNARRWQREQRTGLDLLADHPDRVHRVRYEDLLQEPEDVAEGLCKFLELPYEPGMLYYYESEDAKEASQSAAVFENLSIPIKSDNFGKYRDRLPAAEIRITEAVAGDELREHGYELEHDETTLEEFELDVDRYEREDGKLDRAASLEDWRENTVEQVARYASRSFSYYMILRYGLLA